MTPNMPFLYEPFLSAAVSTALPSESHYCGCRPLQLISTSMRARLVDWRTGGLVGVHKRTIYYIGMRLPLILHSIGQCYWSTRKD